MFTDIYYSLGCYLLKITSSDVSIGMVTIFRLNHLIFCIFTYAVFKVQGFGSIINKIPKSVLTEDLSVI